MYTRNIQKSIKSVLVNGIPQFGSFSNPPRVIDIKSLKQPYPIFPLPHFLTKTRIRGNIEFFFSTNTYTGTIDIFESVFFSFTEMNFWEKATGKKLAYRSLMPLRKIIPHHLDKSVCVSFHKKRYFRMTWDHIHKTFSFIFHYATDGIRPNAIGVFKSSPNENWGLLTSISPYQLKNRCTAIHVSAMPINGSLSTGTTAQTQSAADSTGQGLFSLRWSFCHLRTKDYTITGFGEWQNKKVSFRLFTTGFDSVEKNIYNENVLFIDGETTPLPPVIITFPKGIMDTWVIQDTESMVDLNFIPKSDTKRTLSILFLRTEYHTMYGKCGGNLRTKEGDLIPLKNFSVIAKKHSLRL